VFGEKEGDFYHVLNICHLDRVPKGAAGLGGAVVRGGMGVAAFFVAARAERL
jgi:hypothetical protein